jgi:hypothetical protein
MELKNAAGWNQTRHDWERYLRLAPDGCFGIECDDVLAASATVMCYGEDLAWIGMVLTLPQFRGRGFARQLTQTCIDVAGNRPTRLDASDAGRPLYESLGFVAECAIDRWRREPSPPPKPPAVSPLRIDPAYDNEVFGADRSALLSDLAQEGGASFDSAYALERPGSNAAFLGPWIAESPDAAETLLRWFVARHASEAAVIDLFPHHPHAGRLAAALGFQPFRQLTRMVLAPTPVALPDPRIYGIAGFEWG